MLELGAIQTKIHAKYQGSPHRSLEQNFWNDILLFLRSSNDSNKLHYHQVGLFQRMPEAHVLVPYMCRHYCCMRVKWYYCAAKQLNILQYNSNFLFWGQHELNVGDSLLLLYTKSGEVWRKGFWGFFFRFKTDLAYFEREWLSLPSF